MVHNGWFPGDDSAWWSLNDSKSYMRASTLRSPNHHLPVRRLVGRPDNSRFAAVRAWGRRPVPFRTRKLRPSTAMVLHSTGCGRVARRRITRWMDPGGLGCPSGSIRISGGMPHGIAIRTRRTDRCTAGLP